MPIPEVAPVETWPTRHLLREGTTRRAALIGLAAGLAAKGQPARAQPAEVAIDTHAHIFRRGLKLADVRRYAPDYDASLSPVETAQALALMVRLLEDLYGTPCGI